MTSALKRALVISSRWWQAWAINYPGRQPSNPNKTAADNFIEVCAVRTISYWGVGFEGEAVIVNYAFPSRIASPTTHG
jgi:hypothetical protein